MAFNPATMALAGGVAQGIMGFAGGMSKSKAASQNAAINRQWAIYAKDRSINEILTIQAQEKREKAKQDITNRHFLGQFMAKIGGASGVAMSGSTADAMAGQAEMAWNKMQNITADSLLQQAGAENLGNQEVYKYTVAAQQYDHAASAAKSAAWMGLAVGGIAGVAGALGQDANYFDSWFGSRGDDTGGGGQGVEVQI